MNERLIILTGGIGSGKSAVGRLFAERGATVVHADGIGHDILEPEGLVFREVADRWPQVVVEGRIDRRALGRIVFSDPDQLAELEALTHPAIRDRILELVDEAGDGPVVVELPILRDFLGEGWTRVVVDAPVEIRAARLRERGLADDEIEARLAAQPDRAEWLAAADHVIDNSGSLQDLERLADDLLGRLTSSRWRPAPQ
jgi:dephospho-CoA kinase